MPKFHRVGHGRYARLDFYLAVWGCPFALLVSNRSHVFLRIDEQQQQQAITTASSSTGKCNKLPIPVDASLRPSPSITPKSVVPDFLVQTGDKTGTGAGGESFFGGAAFLAARCFVTRFDRVRDGQ